MFFVIVQVKKFQQNFSEEESSGKAKGFEYIKVAVVPVTNAESLDIY